MAASDEVTPTSNNGTEVPQQSATTETAPTAVTPASVTQPEKIVFSPAQQIKLTELIKRAKSEAAKELRAIHYATVKELETVRAAQHLPQVTADELANTSEKLAAVRAEVASLESIKLDAFKRAALIEATSGENFFDPEVAAQLLANDVAFVEGELVVRHPRTGEPRINKYGDRMTLAEAATELAVRHKYMVKSTLQFGAGSVTAASRTSEEAIPLEAVFGPKSDSAIATRIAMQRPGEYKRMRREAVKVGLLSI